MIEWTYRYGSGAPMDYVLRMGLWSFEEERDGTLRRVHTPVADRFRELSR
jgi:hypothetical protein